MAKLVMGDGREIQVNKSVRVTKGDTYVDDVKVEPQKRLVYRSARTPDGTFLESSHKCDFQSHVDDNGKEYFLDGRGDHLNSNLDGDCKLFEIYADDDITVLREVVGRSGMGKDMQGPYRCALLKDMSDEWVIASIDYVEEEDFKDIYRRELLFRESNGITIMDDTYDYFGTWEVARERSEIKNILK